MVKDKNYWKEYGKRWHQNKRNDVEWMKKKKEAGVSYYKKVRENPEQLKKYREMTNEWRSTPSGIFTSLKNRGREDFNLKKEDFTKWYLNQEKRCTYCNLTLEEIRTLPAPYNRKNGLVKFSIDRKDNNKGYSLDNITLSCFTCNTIKNNFLTSEEMMEVGREIIEPKLKKILKNE